MIILVFVTLRYTPFVLRVDFVVPFVGWLVHLIVVAFVVVGSCAFTWFVLLPSFGSLLRSFVYVYFVGCSVVVVAYSAV